MRVIFSALCVLLLMAPALAVADVLLPEETACYGKAKGSSCTVEEKQAIGTCQSSTCYHNDYSHKDDAGMPTLVASPCGLCLGDDGGSLPYNHDSGCPVVGNDGGYPANGKDGGGSTLCDGGGFTENPAENSGGGCSTMPGTSTSKEIGAFLLAGSFSLLFFLRRRRRSQ